MTASYGVLQSSLVTILKELVNAKQANQQLKRNIQSTEVNKGGTTQTIMLTKPTTMTPKTPVLKAEPVSKRNM